MLFHQRIEYRDDNECEDSGRNHPHPPSELQYASLPPIRYPYST